MLGGGVGGSDYLMLIGGGLVCYLDGYGVGEVVVSW